MKCVLRSETSGFMTVWNKIDAFKLPYFSYIYIEGMSYKEAAAVLRKSAKQIDKLLQLGKKKLRPLLETEGIKSAFND